MQTRIGIRVGIGIRVWMRMGMRVRMRMDAAPVSPATELGDRRGGSAADPGVLILQRLRERIHGARVADFTKRADRMTTTSASCPCCGNQGIDGVVITDLAKRGRGVQLHIHRVVLQRSASALVARASANSPSSRLTMVERTSGSNP